MALESAQPITIRLDGHNYSHWSFLMRSFIKGRGLWKYISGDSKCPSKDDSKYADWEINNNNILTWIANTVTPLISMQLGKVDIAKQAWDFLSQRYVHKNFADKYKLEWDIRYLKQQKGQSISDFHSEMSVI